MIPEINKTDFNYEGTISLEKWEKMFPERKSIFLNIGGDADTEIIVNEHKEGYEYLLANQEEILNAVIKEIYRYFCSISDEYEDGCEKPIIKSEVDIAENIIPEGIYINNIAKDGISYIGYEFSCSWDKEHGVGLMMHKDRIVEIGFGDVSVLSWIAEEDL